VLQQNMIVGFSLQVKIKAPYSEMTG